MDSPVEAGSQRHALWACVSHSASRATSRAKEKSGVLSKNCSTYPRALGFVLFPFRGFKECHLGLGWAMFKGELNWEFCGF